MSTTIVEHVFSTEASRVWFIWYVAWLALSSTLTSLWMGTRKLILESCIRELAYWSSDTQVRIMKHRRHTLKFTSSTIQCEDIKQCNDMLQYNHITQHSSVMCVLRMCVICYVCVRRYVCVNANFWRIIPLKMIPYNSNCTWKVTNQQVMITALSIQHSLFSHTLNITTPNCYLSWGSREEQLTSDIMSYNRRVLQECGEKISWLVQQLCLAYRYYMYKREFISTCIHMSQCMQSI